MLSRCPIPGLFITGTDTGVGKTLVAAAIANWFVRHGVFARRCASRWPPDAYTGAEGLVSEDAEFLAHHARAKFPLNTICPQRFTDPWRPPSRPSTTKQKIDWNAIDSAIAMMVGSSDVLIVEGVGGILVPVDKQLTVLDMAKWLDCRR